MAEGPNLTLRQVGRRMKALREAAHISLRDVVAEGLVNSKDTLSRMEAGQRTTLTFSNIRDIAAFCGASEDLQAALVTWYRNANRASWGEGFAGAVVKDFHRLIEMEGYVDQLRIYEPNLISGLAQTERYARAAHERDPELTEEQIRESLTVRMRRQEHFWGRQPLPAVEILLGEQALRGACDREQIDRLKELAGRASVAVRVLPLDDGPYPSLRGPFGVLRFNANEDPDCVYTEGLEGSRYEVKPETVLAYDRLFRSAYDQARPIEEY